MTIRALKSDKVQNATSLKCIFPFARIMSTNKDKGKCRGTFLYEREGSGCLKNAVLLSLFFRELIFKLSTFGIEVPR